MEGRYVPSLLAAIGEVIETHMVRTGFLQSDEARPDALGGETQRQDELSAQGGAPQAPRALICPRCSSTDYVQQRGLLGLYSCGFSRCG